MKNKYYTMVMQNILHLLSEGVHVLDKDGNSIIYNDAMADLEKMDERDVLNKPFAEVFKNLDAKDSTLLQALHNKKSTINKNQSYLNKDGKKITTINTTVPIIDNGEVIAAVEVSKDITKIQEMSNRILELGKELKEPDEVKELKIKKYRFSNLVGKSPNFKAVLGIARKAANSSASVFIYGETGTGKELVAQSIHFDGTRQSKPFLAQNCAALPENLLESILFGTAKGGFTGAVDRAGLFEQANGGTLLLDEINSMPYELQGKLLRVLQEDYIRRVGGSKDIPIDVRIIATVNEPAEALIKQGKLRKDLYYRIKIIPIDVPPLRERRDDILLLAEQFIDKHNKRYNKNVWMLSDKAKDKLLNYNYPGNVRELENIIMAAISMIDDENVITDKHILIDDVHNSVKIDYEFLELGVEKYLENLEKEIIKNTLITYQNNITKSAEHLKIKRQTLQHKIKKYNLNS
jgi:arginine utilization regulatory protein